jgi:hypothetical protein
VRRLCDQYVEEAKARALREHLVAHPEHESRAVTYVVNHIITDVPRLLEGIRGPDTNFGAAGLRAASASQRCQLSSVPREP